jgi:hypothetical protein
MTQVRSTLVTRKQAPEKKREAMRVSCRGCGAAIVVVKMPRGIVHYDDIEGLRRVKHRCNTLGCGLSKKRDEETLDLFDDLDK